MNTYPSKESYLAALETIKKYEKRQNDLKRLASDLSYQLSQFDSFKFKINKKQKEILFTGVLPDGEIVIGQSKLQQGDAWNETIGKLIAVLKALKLKDKVEEVMEYVESKFIFEGHSHSGLYTLNGSISNSIRVTDHAFKN
ncbi:hypothetical protein [Shouchella clausii]|uniref:hypothetical protein n=1 Tax=Shouchella clausii TaxID=79880 RepID=UPI001C734D5F|nr:hypothetical protein [Shouchella clausii]MBX0320231.1 hypothetical protein [Shouchella clausii]MEB5480753.1 hypothetical protein [Shouchella clausii]